MYVNKVYGFYSTTLSNKRRNTIPPGMQEKRAKSEKKVQEYGCPVFCAVKITTSESHILILFYRTFV